MTQSIGVRRRDLACAVDKIACFLQSKHYFTHTSFRREEEMAAGTYQTSEFTVKWPCFPITKERYSFGGKR